MNLDDLTHFQTIDTANVLAAIDAFPDQVQAALAAPLPAAPATCPDHLAVWGWGAARHAVDLAYALADPALPLTPIETDTLPAWVQARTVIITLSAARASAAQARGATVIHLPTESRFHWAGPLVTLLRLWHGWGLTPDPAADVLAAVAALRTQQATLGAASPIRRNPAKRMAGQVFGRQAWVTGAGFLAPVARLWAAQLHHTVKATAWALALPQAAHSEVVGTLLPESLVGQVMALWLRAPLLPARTLHQLDMMRQQYLTLGFNTDFFDGVGPSPLAQALTLAHAGDYLAYYTAMAYGMDPFATPQRDLWADL